MCLHDYTIAGPRHKEASSRPSWSGEREPAVPSLPVRAYVVGDVDHLFRTWHPRTRPDDVRADPTTHWTGLEILATGADTVEFVASWEGGRMHEVSRFAACRAMGLRRRAQPSTQRSPTATG